MTQNPINTALILTAHQKKAISEMRQHAGVYYWMPATCKQLAEEGLAQLVGNTGGYMLTEKGRAVNC